MLLPFAASFRIVDISSAVLVERVVGKMHEHVRGVVNVRVRVPTRCESDVE